LPFSVRPSRFFLQISALWIWRAVAARNRGRAGGTPAPWSLARILHDDWRHAISAASEPAQRAGSARPSISSPRKQIAFSAMSGVNPEESGHCRTVSALRAHFS
jgi:hypothetical protein